MLTRGWATPPKVFFVHVQTRASTQKRFFVLARGWVSIKNGFLALAQGWASFFGAVLYNLYEVKSTSMATCYKS